MEKDVKYTIQTPNAEKPEESVIAKIGGVVNFTMGDIKRDIERLNKIKKELTAQKELDGAKMKNIEQFHPFVLKMSPLDLSTASLYVNSRGRVGLCDQKLAQIEDQLAAYAEELPVIEEQLPELKAKSEVVAEAEKIINEPKK